MCHSSSEFAMKRLGASELAFANIVAKRDPTAPSRTPSPRTASFEAGDFVVFDFGARVGGYCSDTTRTVCIGGASDEQVRVYEAVRRANEWVAAKHQAGRDGREDARAGRKRTRQGGLREQDGGTRSDMAWASTSTSCRCSPTNKEALVAGNVVTDEPGVYLPGEMGGRIEDCGVVTENGFESFCDITHELMMIE